jgi:hypothetical protein
MEPKESMMKLAEEHMELKRTKPAEEHMDLQRKGAERMKPAEGHMELKGQRKPAVELNQNLVTAKWVVQLGL